MPDDNTSRYFNRELSLLEFNARVLREGMDPTNPILERLKFIGIVSSNLDEFFMVRIASLSSSDINIKEIHDRVRHLIHDMNQYVINQLLPELESAGIQRIKPEFLNEAQINYVQGLFEKELLPILTPIAFEDGRPLPVLSSLRFYMVVKLLNASEGALPKYAVVEIPHQFPRMIQLPNGGAYSFVLIEDIISLFISKLFVGYEIVDKGLIRLTRGAELTWDEEKDEDFMKVMAEALRLRKTGSVVRLEISSSQGIKDDFIRKFNLTQENVYASTPWLDLKGISQFAFQGGFEELKRPSWEPKLISDFEKCDDIWKLLKEQNVYVIHPYQSFDAINRFIATAADDPDVMAIKQTLYRTAPDSMIIDSLVRAAEKGKKVTALVELKARFDEEKNIEWAKRLEMAGVNVLYGVRGLKTHAKVCLVVRREPEGIRRYIHLSTGNYNENTARIYSDIGIFTADENFANDITAFFNMITGYSQPIAWSKIEVAPYGLRNRLKRLISREGLRSTKDKPGLIMLKMNSLVDPVLIEALYQASQANVEIKLNVRGVCCLKPGIKDLSETIEVISIIDMFLEHSRIFYFLNGGDDELYLSSADWMPRNLDRRVELMFPIDDKDDKRALLEILKLYFRDNVKAWRLQASGTYQKIETDPKKKFHVQEYLCKKVTDEENTSYKTTLRELKPQKPIKL